MELELYLCRHGETEWTLAGRHTGTTDLELTDRGREQASFLGRRLPKFDLVLSSPKLRASETCRLAGIHRFIQDSDAVEWNYGEYEGLTSAQIQKLRPGWNLFSDGAPGGESPADVSNRADRILQKLKGKGRVALFSHGHFLRLLAARFLQFQISQASHLLLDCASKSILTYEHQKPVMKLWNETN